MKKFYLYLIICLISNSIFSQEGVHFDWAKQIGTNNWEGGKGVLSDTDGNVYTYGMFVGTTDFDPSDEEYLMTSFNSDTSDIFIQKLDADGNFLWALSFGNTNVWSDVKMKIDAAGDLVLCGNYYYSVDFDPGEEEFIMTSTGGSSIFILKLTSDGEFIWVKTLESEYASIPYFTIDTEGNFIISGNFYTEIDADPGPDSLFLTAGIQQAIFFISLTSEGEPNWAETIGNNSWSGVHDVCTDGIGNAYFTGFFSGLMDFDPGANLEELSSSEGGAFLLKMDNDGAFSNVTNFGSNSMGTCYPQGMSCDDFDNLYISGTFNSTASFNTIDSITSNGGTDIFIQKLNSDGVNMWTKTFGSTNNEQTTGHVIDQLGNIYTPGTSYDVIDVDPGLAEHFIGGANTTTTFIQKLDSDGNFVGVQAFEGEIYSNVVSPLSVDELGHIYFSSLFIGTVDFNPNDGLYEMTSEGNSYATFTLKLSQDSCAYLSIQTNDVASITCNEIGSISVEGQNGLEPYSYLWDTDPISETNAISIEDPGMYTVVVSDSNNCARTSTYIIDGPDYDDEFDLSANLVTTPFRTGFSSLVSIDANNSGCVEVSGQLILISDELVTYDSSSTEPDLIIGDSLIWNFTDLSYESQSIQLPLYFTTDSLAAIGDTVCFDLIINPSEGDIDPDNNVKHYCFPIINAYDPNDKQVYPQGACDEQYVLNDESLTYTIRFQNTGNAEALNVHIIDSISEYLDINSTNIVSSSHAMYTEVKEGNVLDFIFNDIILPDSTSDEAASHGYVIFEISPIEDLDDFTLVTNTSEIYFDFNPAVVTNTVYNTMVNSIPACAVGIEEGLVSNGNSIWAYPNPTQGDVTIHLGELDNVSLRVINTSGQSIFHKENIQNEKFQFDLDAPAGLYILMLSTKKETQYIKLLKSE